MEAATFVGIDIWKPPCYIYLPVAGREGIVSWVFADVEIT
jgi:hypothetical protein